MFWANKYVAEQKKKIEEGKRFKADLLMKTFGISFDDLEFSVNINDECTQYVHKPTGKKYIYYYLEPVHWSIEKKRQCCVC
jgi:hypothetical protein